MIRKIKWLMFPVAVMLVLVIALAGCAQSAPTTPAPPSPKPPVTTPAPTTTPAPAPPTPKPSPTPTNPSELSGTITEAGSTTVQPVAESIAAAFMSKYPGVKVVIQGGGSGVGVKSAAEGTVDIGAASRELTPEEATKVTPHVLAKDGIAIVAHKSQTVSNLTKAQVADIFTGKITKWSQIGGPDKTIHVIAREEGSGTRAAFEEMVLPKGAVITSNAILQPSNGALRTAVAGDPDAIGFLSFGYLDDTVKAFSIDGIPATVENAKKGTYPIVRPLLFLTKGEPKGIVKEFINFCLGPAGQEIVAKDYIPVN